MLSKIENINSRYYLDTLYDYIFSVEGQTITAFSTSGDYPSLRSNDLSDITKEIQKSRIDPYKNTNGSHNVSMYFRKGIYNSYDEIVFKGGYPTNTRATKISVTMISEDANSTSIRLNKQNLGKDILTFTDGLRVNFQNFTISAQSGNGKALYLKAPSTTNGFSVRDSEINNIYTYHNTDGYSVVMENMFSVKCPYISVTNFGGSGIDLRNNSTTTNFGNSIYGKIDSISSGNEGTTAFKISTLKGSGKIMNLLKIDYLEIGSLKGEGGGSDSKGVHFESSSNVNIGLLVSEYLGENIHFENTANVTIGNTIVTIEKARGQKEGESYGVRLDNCSNVKILNGIYYTTDFTTNPIVINDDIYKNGNSVSGELQNGLPTKNISRDNWVNTKLNIHQNGNIGDTLVLPLVGS